MLKRGMAGRVEIETQVVAGSKRCGACGKAKPLDEFWKQAAAGDGLKWDCKACHRRYNCAWAQRHPPQKKPPGVYLEAGRKYRESPRGKAWRARYVRSARGRLVASKGSARYRLRHTEDPAKRRRLEERIRMYEAELARLDRSEGRTPRRHTA